MLAEDQLEGWASRLLDRNPPECLLPEPKSAFWHHSPLSGKAADGPKLPSGNELLKRSARRVSGDTSGDSKASEHFVVIFF